jgi:hypothetical protein
MFEMIKMQIAEGKTVMVDIGLLSDKQAKELNMLEVVTNDPWDGANMSYWISSMEGVEHAEKLLINGMSFSATPVAIW